MHTLVTAPDTTATWFEILGNPQGSPPMTVTSAPSVGGATPSAASFNCGSSKRLGLRHFQATVGGGHLTHMGGYN